MNRNSQLLVGLVASLLLLLTVGIPQPAGADGIEIEPAEWDPNSDIEMPVPKAILTRKEG